MNNVVFYLLSIMLVNQAFIKNGIQAACPEMDADMAKNCSYLLAV